MLDLMVTAVLLEVTEFALELLLSLTYLPTLNVQANHVLLHLLSLSNLTIRSTLLTSSHRCCLD